MKQSEKQWSCVYYDVCLAYGLRQVFDRKISLHPFIENFALRGFREASVKQPFRRRSSSLPVWYLCPCECRIQIAALLTVRWCPGIVSFRLRILRRRCVCSSRGNLFRGWAFICWRGRTVLTPLAGLVFFFFLFFSCLFFSCLFHFLSFLVFSCLFFSFLFFSKNHSIRLFNFISFHSSFSSL